MAERDEQISTIAHTRIWWLSLFSSLDKFSEDFMNTRNQPQIQQREFFD